MPISASSNSYTNEAKMGTIIFLVMLFVIFAYVDDKALPTVVKVILGIIIMLGTAMFLNPK